MSVTPSCPVLLIHDDDPFRKSLIATLDQRHFAVTHQLETMAFPAISCGAYGYPVPAAVDVAVKTVREFLNGEPKIARVIFVVANDEIEATYRAALRASG